MKLSDQDRLDRQQYIRSLGYGGEFGSGGGNRFLNENFGTQDVAQIKQRFSQFPGVVPMTSEPLHQFERTALTRMGQPDGQLYQQSGQLAQQMMADPRGFAAKYTAPRVGEYQQQAADAYGSGMAAITPQDVSQYMNPYQEQVVEASMNRLNEEGERARAALLSNLGRRGAASFGDTSQGVQLGMLGKELLSKRADIFSNLMSQGYRDAMSAATGQKGRALQAGQGFAGLGGQAQNIFANAYGLGSGAAQTGQRMGADELSGQLQAGSYIRNYNQNVANQVGSNILGEQGDRLNKIQTVLGMLPQYQSGSSQQNQYMPSTASNVANVIGGTDWGSIGSAFSRVGS
jgi:hypothetical protein